MNRVQLQKECLKKNQDNGFEAPQAKNGKPKALGFQDNMDGVLLCWGQNKKKIMACDSSAQEGHLYLSGVY